MTLIYCVLFVIVILLFYFFASSIFCCCFLDEFYCCFRFALLVTSQSGTCHFLVAYLPPQTDTDTCIALISHTDTHTPTHTGTHAHTHLLRARGTTPNTQHTTEHTPRAARRRSTMNLDWGSAAVNAILTIFVFVPLFFLFAVLSCDSHGSSCVYSSHIVIISVFRCIFRYYLSYIVLILSIHIYWPYFDPHTSW